MTPHNILIYVQDELKLPLTVILFPSITYVPLFLYLSYLEILPKIIIGLEIFYPTKSEVAWTAFNSKSLYVTLPRSDQIIKNKIYCCLGK